MLPGVAFPLELFITVLSYSRVDALLSARRVCVLWRDIIGSTADVRTSMCVRYNYPTTATNMLWCLRACRTTEYYLDCLFATSTGSGYYGALTKALIRGGHTAFLRTINTTVPIQEVHRLSAQLLKNSQVRRMLKSMGRDKIFVPYYGEPGTEHSLIVPTIIRDVQRHDEINAKLFNASTHVALHRCLNRTALYRDSKACRAELQRRYPQFELNAVETPRPLAEVSSMVYARYQPQNPSSTCASIVNIVVTGSIPPFDAESGRSINALLAPFGSKYDPTMHRSLKLPCGNGSLALAFPLGRIVIAGSQSMDAAHDAHRRFMRMFCFAAKIAEPEERSEVVVQNIVAAGTIGEALDIGALATSTDSVIGNFPGVTLRFGGDIVTAFPSGRYVISGLTDPTQLAALDWHARVIMRPFVRAAS